MPPIPRPPTTMGAPPRVGKTSPCATIGITCQKPQPLAPSVVNSAVLRRNAAAAVALARDVSGVRKPVPSPRALRTRRPASSTTVTVIGEPSAFALPCAAFTAASAIGEREVDHGRLLAGVNGGPRHAPQTPQALGPPRRRRDGPRYPD